MQCQHVSRRIRGHRLWFIDDECDDKRCSNVNLDDDTEHACADDANVGIDDYKCSFVGKHDDYKCSFFVEIAVYDERL
jgi:hypothetical protein